ncbi:DUF6039 family protein [Catellatospora vulcania]|uniref:DUF6039 family protein n=1 Tax=Catellatospora vulcania TaxID=1460450 RepID=UPI0012D45EC2|nr:DUF6039 family protein [Catellatospora vulcania]
MTEHGGKRFAPLPAYHQTSVPAEKLLNSANAGFLIHRVGQLRAEFRDEGLKFSTELVELINSAQAGHISIFTFEELFGTENRLHWLLHLKQPNDYQRMLEMVDHSKRWRDVATKDRLPSRGGGNWERIFVEGSMRETIICPQHGLGHHDDDDDDTLDTFQPAAMFQTTLPPEQLLHSVNSALTVHRRMQVRYKYREEARQFWFGWCARVTEALTGRATAFLYEEMWGQQDTLHLLIHLADLEAYTEVKALAQHDQQMRELLGSQVAPGEGSGLWHETVLDGTMADTLWAPLPGRAAPAA